MKELLAKCLSKRRDIQAAYIFGSVASGRTRPGSDIDIAVLLKGKSSRVKSLDYRLQLAAEMSSLPETPDSQSSKQQCVCHPEAQSSGGPRWLSISSVHEVESYRSA